MLPQYADLPIHLVLDNHRAHHTQVAVEAMVEQGFTV